MPGRPLAALIAGRAWWDAGGKGKWPSAILKNPEEPSVSLSIVVTERAQLATSTRVTALLAETASQKRLAIEVRTMVDLAAIRV
jgi:hypothetical protein